MDADQAKKERRANRFRRVKNVVGGLKNFFQKAEEKAVEEIGDINTNYKIEDYKPEAYMPQEEPMPNLIDKIKERKERENMEPGYGLK